MGTGGVPERFGRFRTAAFWNGVGVSERQRSGTAEAFWNGGVLERRKRSERKLHKIHGKMLLWHLGGQS